MTDVVINREIPVKQPKVVINNAEAVAAFRAQGGRIRHLRPSQSGEKGITFAYIPKRGNLVEVATAIQHPHDDFAKKMGTKVAIEHFNAGKTTLLPWAMIHWCL